MWREMLKTPAGTKAKFRRDEGHRPIGTEILSRRGHLSLPSGTALRATDCDRNKDGKRVIYPL